MSKAWILHEDQVLYSEYIRQPHEPHSAVSILIQGIFDHFPSSARSLLRQRIFYDEPLSPADQAMIKVCGKRASPGTWKEDKPRTFVQKKIYEQGSLPQGMNPREWISELEQRCQQGVKKSISDRKVGAILLSKSGELLAYGHNSNGLNKSRHAEINMLQNWWALHHTPVPEGSQIHVSLKPCRMCSAWIHSCAQDPLQIEVHYRDKDLGPWSLNTLLEMQTRQWPAEQTVFPPK